MYIPGFFQFYVPGLHRAKFTMYFVYVIIFYAFIFLTDSVNLYTLPLGLLTLAFVYYDVRRNLKPVKKVNHPIAASSLLMDNVYFLNGRSACTFTGISEGFYLFRVHYEQDSEDYNDRLALTRDQVETYIGLAVETR